MAKDSKYQRFEEIQNLCCDRWWWIYWLDLSSWYVKELVPQALKNTRALGKQRSPVRKTAEKDMWSGDMQRCRVFGQNELIRIAFQGHRANLERSQMNVLGECGSHHQVTKRQISWPSAVRRTGCCRICCMRRVRAFTGRTWWRRKSWWAEKGPPFSLETTDYMITWKW